MENLIVLSFKKRSFLLIPTFQLVNTIVGTFFMINVAHAQTCPEIFLKPDSSRIVRLDNADNITYVYYFDSSKTKPRSEYIYSLDNSDGREVCFVRFYFSNGQKSMERTYKNYNRALKQLDRNFVLSKENIMNEGRDDKLDFMYSGGHFPFKQYTQVGAEVSWYCNGNKSDSIWIYPTKITQLDCSGFDNNGREICYKHVYTERNGYEYEWYESGNISSITYYEHDNQLMAVVYFDTSEKKISGIGRWKVNSDGKLISTVDKAYYENGNLKDSIIHDQETNETIKTYDYYEDGKPKSVIIEMNDFVVYDFYNENGTPRQFNRKALYKKQWYVDNEGFFEGRPFSFKKERRFFQMHPEFGTIGDSLLTYTVNYNKDGTIDVMGYVLLNGDNYTYIYGKNGILNKKIIINTKGQGLEMDYDEKGELENQRLFYQKPK
jgi:antitoxin component YwqK of YwqJK toxin-antitoxin module